MHLGDRPFPVQELQLFFPEWVEALPPEQEKIKED